MFLDSAFGSCLRALRDKLYTLFAFVKCLYGTSMTLFIAYSSLQYVTYTILPKVLAPLLMNRFDYFSNFYEYKS